VVSAPELVSTWTMWDDRPRGNGNGMADPGEQLNCRWKLQNIGHFKTGAVRGWEPDPGLFPFSQLQFGSPGPVQPGEEVELSFSLVMPLAGAGTVLNGTFSAGDHYGLVEDSLVLIAGRHFEDFSRGARDYPLVDRSSIGWGLDQDISHSPMAGLISGRISHGQASSVSLQLSCSDVDTLGFYFRVSSEENYDFLQLYLDSGLVESWSGERIWEKYQMILEKGFHEITWTYQKDQNTSMGKDAAWIDDITFWMEFPLPWSAAIRLFCPGKW